MKTYVIRIAAVLVFAVLFSTVGLSSTGYADKGVSDADKERIEQSFGKLPLYFIENHGQVHKDVAYYVRGSDKTLYFTSSGVTFALTGKEGEETKRWAVKLEFIGANPNCKPRGEDKQEAIFSYFKGKPEEWKTGVPTYKKVVYEELWPGIDLVYKGTVNQLKYEFAVKPGADPKQIRLAYHGAKDVHLKKTGELKVTTPLGGFEDARPYAYQNVGDKEVKVSMEYALEKQTMDGLFSYSFLVGDYEKKRPLIFDPAMLLYSGFLGGSNVDSAYGIAVDADGSAYVTGTTCSWDFPVLVGPDLTFNGGIFSCDGFVAKVSPSGDSLMYCGFLGGSGDEGGIGIAVDASGSAYVTGETWSPDFPVLVGPDLSFNGYCDGFVAKVSPSGDSLVYSGFLGGSSGDGGNGIAVDASGFAYVAGYTYSSDFPVFVGPDLTWNGRTDAFVAKVSPSGDSLVYSGFLGGSNDDGSSGIAVDTAGSAYVTGVTRSWDFPVLVGPDLTFNGGYYDAFITKVSPLGDSLVYNGYIGGSSNDHGNGIAVDADGCAYVTGETLSSDFPVLVGPDLTFSGAYYDAFVTKVSPSGDSLVYSGFLGGSNYEYGYGIAVDADGCAYVTGETWSSDFPVLVGPDLTFNGGYCDAFVAKVSPSGDSLMYSGFLGGSGDEGGWGIAVDAAGSTYLTGYTWSWDFPVLVGPDLTFNGGYHDAFVAKVPSFHIVLRAGNVNTGVGNPVDVLFANINNSGPSAGSDAFRAFNFAPGTSVKLTMDVPPNPHPIRPGEFALYLITYEPGIADIADQPYSIGTSCMPMPLSNGNPKPPPYTMVNNIGYNSVLGKSILDVGPAPCTIFDVPSLPLGTYTFQGYIFDGGSAGRGVSLTNAIVLKVQ